MHKTLIALTVAVLAAGPAVAAEKDDAMVPVSQFTAAFNKGDTKTASALCSDVTAIIDDVPPHAWNGAGACAAWMNDFDADAKKKGITPGALILQKPRHVDVNADRAYVVATGTYSYKLKGKSLKETGALTVALQKGASGWRLAGWAWTKR
jgi:hypothetical protein